MPDDTHAGVRPNGPAQGVGSTRLRPGSRQREFRADAGGARLAGRENMIAALEGWSFEGPKGEYTIRESDHALIQPMFQARLVGEGDNWVPELLDTVPAEEAAPAEAE